MDSLNRLELNTQNSHPNVEIKFVNVEHGDSTGQISLDGYTGVGADLLLLHMISRRTC